MSKRIIGIVTAATLPSAIPASGKRIPAAFSILWGRKQASKRHLICNQSNKFTQCPYRFAAKSNNRDGIYGFSTYDTGSSMLLGTRMKSSSADSDGKIEKKPLLLAEEVYVLRFDGDSRGNPGVAGAGMVLYDAVEGFEVWAHGQQIERVATFNEAGYLALISGLTRALDLGVRHVVVQCDNDLILKQLMGEYKVKNEKLKPLFQEVSKLRNDFGTFQISQIPKKENDRADKLAKNAMNVESGTESKRDNEVASDMQALSLEEDNIESQHAGSDISSQKQEQSPKMKQMLSPDKIYVLRFDGGSRGNPGVAGSGMVLYDAEEGAEVWSGQKYLGEDSTNNVAEYTGLLTGMKCAYSLGARHIVAQGDSLLVVNQLNGEWKVKNQGLKPIFQEVMKLRGQFESFQINHIPREENSRADRLANKAMDDRKSTPLDVRQT